MEKYLCRGFSITSTTILFGLEGGPTAVNIMSMTALNRTMTHLFVYLDMFSD